MMMLSGRTPGIAANLRLSFWTGAYSDGFDEIGRQAPPGLLTSSSQCDIDDVSDSPAAHMDVTERRTSLTCVLLVQWEGVHLSLSQAVQANSCQWNPKDGGGVYSSSVSIEVSPEEDTITLIGDVPGITPQSRLVFKAYDHLNGSVAMHRPSHVGINSTIYPIPCRQETSC